MSTVHAFVHSSCMDDVCLLQCLCNLQNVGRILREMNAVHDKHNMTGGGDMAEIPHELQDLGSISIDRDRENRTLRKILLLANNGNGLLKLNSMFCGSVFDRAKTYLIAGKKITSKVYYSAGHQGPFLFTVVISYYYH